MVCVFQNATVSEWMEVTKKRQNWEILMVIYEYNQYMHEIDIADNYCNKWLNYHQNWSWKQAGFFSVLKLSLSNLHFLWKPPFHTTLYL